MMNLIIIKFFLFQYDLIIEKKIIFFGEKIIIYALPIFKILQGIIIKLVNFVWTMWLPSVVCFYPQSTVFLNWLPINEKVKKNNAHIRMID